MLWTDKDFLHMPSMQMQMSEHLRRSDTFSASHNTNNSTSSVTSSNKNALLYSALPKDFTPGPYSVICGRGREVSKSIGNRRLGVLAQIFIPKYSQATRKDEKTSIVTQIVQMVRQANENPAYAFVRHADGQWWQVENLNAREKVGTVLRDMLSEKYRSSTKSKLARRKERTNNTLCTPTLIVEDSCPSPSSSFSMAPPPNRPNMRLLSSTSHTPITQNQRTPQHATSMMMVTTGFLPHPSAGRGSSGCCLDRVSSDDDYDNDEDDNDDDVENYSSKGPVCGAELEMDSLFGPY